MVQSINSGKQKFKIIKFSGYWRSSPSALIPDSPWKLWNWHKLSNYWDVQQLAWATMKNLTYSWAILNCLSKSRDPKFKMTYYKSQLKYIEQQFFEAFWWNCRPLKMEESCPQRYQNVRCNASGMKSLSIVL